jgi:hypothetical protein
MVGWALIVCRHYVQQCTKYRPFHSNCNSARALFSACYVSSSCFSPLMVPRTKFQSPSIFYIFLRQSSLCHYVRYICIPNLSLSCTLTAPCRCLGWYQWSSIRRICPYHTSRFSLRSLRFLLHFPTSASFLITCFRIFSGTILFTHLLEKDDVLTAKLGCVK